MYFRHFLGKGLLDKVVPAQNHLTESLSLKYFPLLGLLYSKVVNHNLSIAATISKVTFTDAEKILAFDFKEPD